MPRKRKAKSHYEELGVSDAATPDEIKRAYRKKAVETHPDKGGDADEFAAAVAAYEVLKDPERRLLYDATGSDRHQVDFEAQVRDRLFRLFNQAIASDIDVPIVETARNNLKEILDRFIPQQSQDLLAQKTKFEKKRKRVKSKAQNLVHMLIDQNLAKIDHAIVGLESEKKIVEACLKELDSYSEDWKDPKPRSWDVGHQPSIYFRVSSFE